jgi:hypothetical protein
MCSRLAAAGVGADRCGLLNADGIRVTAFAANTRRGQPADLELRHRRRARAEDRIRCAKDTGLTNLTIGSKRD